MRARRQHPPGKTASAQTRHAARGIWRKYQHQALAASISNIMTQWRSVAGENDSMYRRAHQRR